MPAADLFCRVVDNYGDIGVCWRLARQLSAEHGWALRLWVDDLASFARIEPGIDPRAASQQVRGIEIVHWTQPAPDLVPRDVVIEAFACDPPHAYVHRMQDLLRPPVWINLEYLSAEPWIDSCHGLPSPQPGGLLKHFFFPGFTPASGGLLREGALVAERDRLQADPAARAAFLATCGLPPPLVATLARGARLATLFCYVDAPATVLAEVLAAQPQPTVLLVPQGVAPYLADSAKAPGLSIHRMPFIAQPDYDRLLWCADLNFVRGEDSFVRAQFARRPMVWHIYPQDDAAHVDKLEAWLQACAPPIPARDVNTGWNGGADAAGMARVLRAALQPAAWNDWRAHAQHWADTLTAQPDLASRLDAFCRALRESRP